MAQKSVKKNPREYATLYLARAIAEGSLPMVEAAIAAGADATAFWIDGRTRLCELGGKRKLAKIDAYFKKLLDPVATKILPSYHPRGSSTDDHGIWSQAFVEFVARLGYHFRSFTMLQNGASGSDLAPVRSAKSAVKLTNSKWQLVTAVKVFDKGAGSTWLIDFDFNYKGDRRIPASRLTFTVDASGWDLLTRFRESMNGSDWPDDLDPILDRQKEWEGDEIMDALLDSPYSFDELIARLRRGGNPFYRWGGKTIGEFDESDPRIKPFMERLRGVCGPELGFHRRIAPSLTKKGLESLLAGDEGESVDDRANKRNGEKVSDGHEVAT